jgi:hypothetical protein
MEGPAASVPQDVVDGLRRLRLATIRELAAEVLQTARTLRWAPEDVLRTLIAAEIAGCEHANRQIRLKQAGFPATKTSKSSGCARPRRACSAPSWRFGS